MSARIGIDVGTSGVKVAVFDEDGACLAEANRRLAVSAPRPGWSEQHPDVWVEAAFAGLDEIAARAPAVLARAGSIGLSGQMLGAVLLDRDGRPVRPAILWNDQRAVREARELGARVPDIGRRTNGRPDPGLTAPKLVWLARHEPEAFARATMLVLPKDYLRLALTGEVATEPSDATGTMLMDCASGLFADDLCAAAGWSREKLPRVCASWEAAGTLRPELARRFGLKPGLVVAAGAGDNMAGSLGVGVAAPGDAVITIGTSAVVCIVDGAFRPLPEKAVLTGLHAAPCAWLSMGVVMSATATFDWLCRLTGADAPTLAAEAAVFAATDAIADAPLMLPTLTGVRTPHDEPEATGALFGLRPGSDRAALAYAALEGIAFQIGECFHAQRAGGVRAERIALVGGGARIALLARLVATVVDAPLARLDGAALAATAGAARLGAVAAGEAGTAALAAKPSQAASVEPDAGLRAIVAERTARWTHALAAERLVRTSGA
jgi:xylulokinase